MSGLSGRRILVVEDTPLTLRLMEEILRSAGCEVFSAETAEEGLEIAQARRPDLVVMDIQLPGIDGIEAISRLKSVGTTATIPVLTVSAHATKRDRDRAMEAGSGGYLQKPFAARRFLGMVLEQLDGGNPNRHFSGSESQPR